MQQDFDELKFLVGNAQDLREIETVPALPIFSERMLEFFAALSNAILKDKRSREFAHVTAFAYWIRRAAVEKEKIARQDILDSRLGRGIAFHIAPSNIPLAFAMSFTVAALAGNINIVRLSKREFIEAEIVCDAMNKLLQNDYQDLQKYFIIIRYPHNDEITKSFSNICDVRIIWGGDNTINTIRKIPLLPRSIELTFADRHSLALIQAEKFLEMNPAEVAKKFYLDTYDIDQNACSSPRAVIWLGDKVEDAKKIFWAAVENLVRSKYEMYPIQAIDKYSAACMFAMENFDVKILPGDNFIMRLEVEKLSGDLMKNKPGGGFFVEYVAKNYAEVLPLLNKQCQTVAVLGIEPKDFRAWIISQGVRGVDRVVNFGETMTLAYMWDGFDLIREMSRFIEA